MTADALALLFRRLVLAANQAGALARPLEVGEILDQLVPYRAARRDGLLDTNDDYLHAVMQLLAGERGYVFADDLMQDDLRNELASPNPDLGVLRTYRGAKVRLATTLAQEVLAGDTTIDLRPATPIATATAGSAPAPTAAPASQPAAPGPAATRTSASTLPRPVAPVRAGDPPPVTTVGGPAGGAAPTRTTPTEPRGVQRTSTAVAESPAALCPYCSNPVPGERDFKYCPHCGLNLRIRRCPGCSAEMEAEWKFCVTCGRSAT